MVKRYRLKKSRKIMRGKATAAKNKSMILAMKRQLKAAKPEVKFFDQALCNQAGNAGKDIYNRWATVKTLPVTDLAFVATGTALSYPDAPNLFWQMEQGVKGGQRLGTRIFVKSIFFDIHVMINFSNAGRYRIIVFGGSIKDMYSSATGTFTNFFYNQYPPSSTIKKVDRKIVRVWYDKVFTYNKTSTDDPGQNRRHKFNFRINKSLACYDALTTNTIFKDNRYNLNMVIIGNSYADNGTVIGAYEGIARIYYTDA